ncbi:antifungal protein ginkbilobin-2-like [Eucalyptus grandis]|uniref:antifungal protein ginkbilobin-2-like n=1 Tax=Eucalyptus grandis TaxID=71139 RepID=UPI00192EFA32|nr:antifungal protein ginkbilobin-2-like [Eucalyptus grandis]
MATFQRIIAILTRLLCICNTVRGLTNTTVMYSICNVQMYVPSTEYGHLVVETLRDLVQETPMWAYGYYNQRPGSEQTVYGHGDCHWKLSQPNCYNCTHLALQTITRQCLNAVGAQVQLVACRMRYEDYVFDESPI